MPPFPTAHVFGRRCPHSSHCGLQIWRRLRRLSTFGIEDVLYDIVNVANDINVVRRRIEKVEVVLKLFWRQSSSVSLCHKEFSSK